MAHLSHSSLQGQGDESREDSSLHEAASDELGNLEALKTGALYPKCALCEKCIQNIVVQALDKTWHPEHFRCHHCHVPISTQKYHVHQGSPYCVEDYAALFLKKCQGCKLPIKDVVVTALNQTWHQDHFVCISCGCKLLNKGFYEKEDNAFCAECYEGKFCPKCCECGDPITDTAVKILNKRWHEACFKCGRCGLLMTGDNGGPFRVSGGEVLCLNCVRERGCPRDSPREKTGREINLLEPFVGFGAGGKMKERSEELLGMGFSHLRRGKFLNMGEENFSTGWDINSDRPNFGHTEGKLSYETSRDVRHETRHEADILGRMAEYIGRMEGEINRGEIDVGRGTKAEKGHWRESGRDWPTQGRGDCVRYFEGSDEETINIQ